MQLVLASTSPYRRALLERLGVPFSLGLTPKRFADGRAMVERVVEQAKSHGRPVREWYSPDWMPRLAWATIILGALLVAGQLLYSSMLYAQYAAGDYPLDKLDRIAGIFPLTALYLASIAAFGVGLGMLFAQQDQLPRASEYLQKAVMLRPDFADALNNLGVILIRLQHYPEAEERFRTCIQVAPKYNQAYLNLARLYMLQRNNGRAREVLVALLQQQPQNQVAQQALEMLH